ncbi:hypothetical protein GCM10023144_36250 [Pigmentiphaga soli]|uniref:TonB C-terminal domain-containing protein n=1 Tax=Pigmentiphaga soli TaxID=1007095 RepID=A0ABP8HFW9_9BURK
MAGDAGYPALIQSRVLGVLWRSAGAAPGAYRALLRFEVDEGGRIRRPRLLGSTGAARRDALLRAALDGAGLDRPPASMPQPVTLLILPGATEPPAAGCGGAATP